MPGNKDETLWLVDVAMMPEAGSLGELSTAYSKLVVAAGASHEKLTEVFAEWYCRCKGSLQGKGVNLYTWLSAGFSDRSLFSVVVLREGDAEVFCKDKNPPPTWSLAVRPMDALALLVIPPSSL